MIYTYNSFIQLKCRQMDWIHTSRSLDSQFFKSSDYSGLFNAASDYACSHRKIHYIEFPPGGSPFLIDRIIIVLAIGKPPGVNYFKEQSSSSCCFFMVKNGKDYSKEQIVFLEHLIHHGTLILYYITCTLCWYDYTYNVYI